MVNFPNFLVLKLNYFSSLYTLGNSLATLINKSIKNGSDSKGCSECKTTVDDIKKNIDKVTGVSDFRNYSTNEIKKKTPI